jgi:putative PEP-CTERM system TPR-repeat lipoprotein
MSGAIGDIMTAKPTFRLKAVIAPLLSVSLLCSASPVRADAPDPAVAQKYQGEADRLLAKNDLEGAQIALKNARKANPKDGAIRVALAGVLLRLNDPDGAKIELDAARQNGGDEAKIIPLLARIYMIQHKYEDLLTDFPLQTDATPEIAAQTLVIRAGADVALGRIDAARAALLDAEKLQPQSLAPKFALARLDFTHNHIDRALAKTDEILAISSSADAHFLKAEILVAKGDETAALVEFDKTIQMDPTQAGAFVERAQVFIGKGDDAKANADIASALALTPRSISARYFQAMLSMRAKDYAGADAILTKYGVPGPDFIQGYYLQAVVKFNLNQIEQAETAVDAYIGAAPNDIKALKLKADIAMRKQDFAAAAQVLERVTALAKSDADGFAMLGRAYMSSNVYRSVEAFRKAIALDPNNAVATRGLALDYLAENQPQNGIAEWEKLILSAPDDAQAAESLAAIYIQQKKYDDAEKIITELVKKKSNDPTPGYLAGLLARDRLHDAEAKAAFLDVQKNFPDFLPAQLELAKLYEGEGDSDAASGVYQAVLAKDPGNLAALQDVSAIMMAQGKPDAVLDLWRKSYRVQPGNIQIEIGLLRAYIANKDIEGGLVAVRDMQLRQPKDPQLYRIRAELESRKKDYKAAITSLTALKEIQPRNPAVLRDLAISQEKDGQLPEAIASIDQARKLDPANVDLALDAIRLTGRADPDKGVAAARRFAQELPDEPAAQTLEGDYLLSIGRPKDAAASYRQAFKDHPSLAVAERVAQSALREGKPADGEKILTDWSAAHPDDAPARFSLASFLESENNFAAAKVQYETLLKQNPNSAPVLNNLALIYQRDGDPRALDYARQAENLAPGNPVIADTLGWIMARKDDPAAGLKLLQRAHELDPADLNIQYHLAFALNAAGKKADAAALLKTTLQSGADFENRNDAQVLLGQLSKG